MRVVLGLVVVEVEEVLVEHGKSTSLARSAGKQSIKWLLILRKEDKAYHGQGTRFYIDTRTADDRHDNRDWLTLP